MPPRAKRGRKALSVRNAKEPSEEEAGTSQPPATKRRRGKAKENGVMEDKKRKHVETEESRSSEGSEEPPPAKKKKDDSENSVEETDTAVLVTKTKQQKVTKTKLKTKKVADVPTTASLSAPIHHPSHTHTPGVVVVMGQGDVGQLGLGEEVMEKKRPFPVGGALEGKNVVQVLCGGMHTVALTDDGKVYTWGCNDEGALGRPTKEGEEYTPGLVERLGNVSMVQVSAGDSHTAALASNGNVYCCGVFRDSNGPFGLVKNSPSLYPELVYSTTYNKAVKITSGSDHVVILTEQGDVYTFGCGEQGQLGRIPECFSTRGGRKGISLLLHPQVVRFRRKKGIPNPKFSDVFCGLYHTFALTRDQGVYVWGLNNYGQLGTDDVKNRFQPEQLPPNWISENQEDEHNKPLDRLQIAGGQHHSVVCQGGSVFVMGRKEYGRLGLGENCEDPHTPVRVPEMKTVGSVAAGTACSFAVTETGEAYSWGMGTNLQLGTGEEEDNWTPVRIAGKKIENRRILFASAGGQHTALLVSRQE